MDNIEERLIKSTAKHTKIASYFLGFLCFVLFVYILIALEDILIPITIAIFLTFLFHPLVVYLRKFKIPKWASLILIIIFVCAGYYLIGLIVYTSLSSLPEKTEAYSANITAFIYQILTPLDLTLKELADMLDVSTQELDATNVLQSLYNAGVINYLINSFTSVLGDFFIALIFWIFMLMGKTKFEERLKFAYADKKEAVIRTINSIDTQLQSYLVIKTLISLATGFFTTIILIAFDIDFAILWGFLTFLLNYIPNIGSMLATIFPILISLLQYGLGLTTIFLAILLLINQNILGNFIEPHYLGRHMDLSPVFVLFSLVFWGWIWGITGMFMAVPIAASMKIFFSNIEPLKPIAILMGSKAHQINKDNIDEILVKKPL